MCRMWKVCMFDELLLVNCVVPDVGLVAAGKI
jgi:hypothetical protein